MLWFFERDQHRVRLETRYDNATAEYVAVATYPDGRHGELWLKPGGTYTAKGRRGDPSNGHWSVKGDQLCLRQSRPIPTPFHYCTAVPHGGLGATWSAKAVSGEPIRVKLVKGRG